MFEVIVRNLQGTQTHGALFNTMVEANSWITAQKSLTHNCPWGCTAYTEKLYKADGKRAGSKNHKAQFSIEINEVDGVVEK